MDFEDTAGYIRHRLRIAGGEDRVIFSPAAMRRIYRQSGGLPRLINVLCDRALLVGYADGLLQLTPAQVAVARGELRREGVRPGSRWRAPLLTAGLPLLLGAALAGWLAGPGGLGPVPDSAAGAPVVAAAPLGTSQERLDGLCRRLAEMPEEKTAGAALNALLPRWKVPPVTGEIAGDEGMRQAARDRGLELTPFKGSLQALLALDSPTVLALSMPGVSGRRYLALTRVTDDRGILVPVPDGEPLYPLKDLRSIWFGRAYLLWKNYLNLPAISVPGTAGEAVLRTQELLQEAGVYSGRPSGIFDRETISAVARFQAGRGIAPDGLVGPQTLILLYQASPRFAAPKISAASEEEK